MTKFTSLLPYHMIAAVVIHPPPAIAQQQGHGFHPPLPMQQYVLRCRLEGTGEPTVVEVPVKLPSPSVDAELNQIVELPQPFRPIRLTRYLPNAVLEQVVVADEKGVGKPAVHLSINGPTQTYGRWLLADDAERNRLSSFIATWRYMAVADKTQRDTLFAQFVNEFTRDPILRIARADGSGTRELPVKVGDLHVLDDLGCRVRILDFFPHFSVDEKTKQPLNRSPRRKNPAVRVEIKSEGVLEERWVYARFPSFAERDGDTTPYRIAMDCPTESGRSNPDYVLVTVGGTEHEAWTRQEEKVTSKRLALDERVTIGVTQYKFHVAGFVRSGKLVESYTPASGRRGVPALRIETSDASGSSAPVWLEVGKRRSLDTANGAAFVTFLAEQERPVGGHP